MSQLPTFFLHSVRTGEKHNEVTEALENCYGDHHLEAVFHSQLKGPQLIRESLQEFAATINHLAHHDHIELLEQLIIKEATCAFTDGRKEQNTTATLEGHEDSEDLDQVLDLKAANTAV
jgi:hypothetical protein